MTQGRMAVFKIRVPRIISEALFIMFVQSCVKLERLIFLEVLSSLKYANNYKISIFSPLTDDDEGNVPAV